MKQLIYGRSTTQRRILAVVLAIALALSLGAAFGVQQQVYADDDRDYDVLIVEELDAASEHKTSFTTESGDYGYFTFQLIGADSSIGLEHPLTEEDSNDVVWDYNTPGADDYVTVDYSYGDVYSGIYGNGYDVEVGILVDGVSAPVGPYSLRAYVDSDPTVYVDLTFVVSDPKQSSPSVTDNLIEYYIGAITRGNNPLTGGRLPSVSPNGYYPPGGFDDRSYATAMDAVAQSQGSIIQLYNNPNLVTRLYNMEYSNVWYPNAQYSGGWYYAVYNSNGSGGYVRDDMSRILGPFEYQLEDDDLVAFVLFNGVESDWPTLFPVNYPN